MSLNFLRLRTFRAALFTILILSSNSIKAQSEITALQTINLRRDTLNLIQEPNKSHLIILSDNNSCRVCFKDLNNPSDQVIDKINGDSLIVKFVCRVENNSGSRRLHLNLLKKDIPNLANDTTVFFDIYNDEYHYNQIAKSGLFGIYSIDHTPAVIIYDPKIGVEVFQYKILYGYLKNCASFSIEELREYNKLH